MVELISGSGGGGGGGRVGGSGSGIEQSNTLRSRNWYNLLLFISEGVLSPIENGDKIERRVFLNGIPIESQDGTINYRGITVSYRNGLVAQTPIAVGTGFSAAVTSSVGQKVSTAVGAVTRTYTNPQGDGAIITLSTPSLRAKSGNNIVGSYVKFRVEISNNNGAFINYLEDSFDGKTTGYSRDYRVRLPPSGPWRIRVMRLTPDVPAIESANTTNDLVWDKTTLIFDDKLSYPNTAQVFLRFDSAFFSSEPTISIKSKPMMLLVPSNYNPILRTYTGSWTGLFKLAATNNPAWVAYNLLVNKRWALGTKITADLVDKWSFYAFGKHCDVSIDNGQGLFKPRHTFTQYIRTQSDAVKSINAMLESCRAGMYESGGQLVLLYDRASKPLGKPFTNANVLTKYDRQGKLEESGFAYECSHINDLPSAINAKWYDPDNFDKPDYVRVTLQDIELSELRERYGDRELDVDLAWCHDIDEARRHCRYKLATAHLEQWTVNFSIDEPGMLRLPGELIPIQDNQTNTQWLGGKVKSSAVGQIELDRQVVINAAGTIIFDVGGTTRDLRITNPVSTVPTSVVTCAVDTVNMPQIGSEWLLNLITNKAAIYRIMSVSNPEQGKYRILAREYIEEKYEVADGGMSIRVNKPFFDKPDPPGDLVVYYDANFTHVGWKASKSIGVNEYVLEYQNFTTSIWQPIYVNANFTDYDLPPTTVPYSIRVAAIGQKDLISDWAYSNTASAFSQTAIPIANAYNNGTVIARNLDGSIVLNKPVYLSGQYSFWIITNSLGGLGGTGGGGYLQTPRLVEVTQAGQTNTIRVKAIYLENGVTKTTNSGFLGAIASFVGPISVNLRDGWTLNEQISFLQVGGQNQENPGGVSVEFNAPGNLATLIPGSYNLAQSFSGSLNDNISRVKVLQGFSAYCTQHIPGENPSLNSPWRLGAEINNGYLENYSNDRAFSLDKEVYTLTTPHILLVLSSEDLRLTTAWVYSLGSFDWTKNPSIIDGTIAPYPNGSVWKLLRVD